MYVCVRHSARCGNRCTLLNTDHNKFSVRYTSGKYVSQDPIYTFSIDDTAHIFVFFIY